MGVFCLAPFLFCAGLFSEEIDRLLVSVNGSVITEGDLFIARSVRALTAEGGDVLPESRSETLDRLINLELIRQEIGNLNIDSEDGIAPEERWKRLQEKYADEGGIEEQLKRLGLAKADLFAFLKYETALARFLDFRFRPFIRISPEAVRSYYDDTLAPRLRSSGIEVPPLASVSDGIEAVLKEERVTEELDQWIEDARRSADIEYFTKYDSAYPVSGSVPDAPGAETPR